MGFLAGHTGRAAGALLAEEGVDVCSVAIGGELRSTQVLMEAGGRVTVLNEPGPAVGAAEWSAYVRTLEAALGDHRLLVCAGSLPPGAPVDGYGRLAALARARGLTCVIDATGETLGAALAAGPDVVTPNLGEAEGLLTGGSAEDVEAGADAGPRALAAAEALVARGARAAARPPGRSAADRALHDQQPQDDRRAARRRRPHRQPAIVGFDDFELADLLGITVVRADAAQLGAEAAALAFARLDGDDRPPQRVTVPTELIQRGSGERQP